MPVFYMRTELLIMLAVLMSAAAYPVFAQDMDQMGTGSGRASPGGSPGMVHTGQRVPNPRALGPKETGSIQRRTQNDQRNDTITKGICIGCSPR
jgi:hypothetical protein